jgi:hypothetical protein
MSVHPERPPVQQRSALAAEVSLDFECSFAAAEANRAAFALLDEREKLRFEIKNTPHYDYTGPRPPDHSNIQLVGEELDVRSCEVIGREWH